MTEHRGEATRAQSLFHSSARVASPRELDESLPDHEHFAPCGFQVEAADREIATRLREFDGSLQESRDDVQIPKQTLKTPGSLRR